MKRIVLIGLMALAAAAAWVEAQESGEGENGNTTRFAAVNIYIDSGDRTLAAYQFELVASSGDIKIVGVEGGEHPAFQSPPYYDPSALQSGRIIIAAFDTGGDLPTGKTRIARVHVWITGDVTPEYDAALIVAGAAEGEEIPATVSVTEGK